MTDVQTTAVASGFKFLEAPRWHEDRIWFSDFYGLQVFSAREDGSDLRTEADVAQQPSGLGWLPDGRLLVVSMRDRRVLRREPDGTLVVHADLSGHATGHANDMVLDGAGRAYVGNFGFDLMSGSPLETASLCRVDPDGTVTEAAADLWFPNGSVITPDGVLIVNETFGNRCTAFDLAADVGEGVAGVGAEGRDRGDAHHDDQGQHDGVLDRGRAVFFPQEVHNKLSKRVHGGLLVLGASIPTACPHRRYGTTVVHGLGKTRK